MSGIVILPFAGVTMRPAILISLLAAILAGCAKEPPAVPVQPVTITASDFCKIASKLSWDLADTRETINGIRRHNAKYDSRCGKPLKPTS